MVLFVEIGLILIVATVAAYVARLFRQPLIPAYIVAGVVLGPVLGIVTDKAIIYTLSEMGIALLLFIVGLELSFGKLRNVAMIATVGGTIQMVLIFLSGVVLALVLGFRNLEAWYLGLTVVFSSTMVVIKILSDRKELDTLHGRIAIGILLTQDLFAIFALSVLNILDEFTFSVLLIAIFKGVILIALSLLIVLYLLPPLFKFAAKSQELLFLVSLSTCFFFSILALNIGEYLVVLFSSPIFGHLPPSLVASLSSGFSVAIGAFIAGIGLANLPYNLEIISRVKSLRDFFTSLFFVSLGLELVFDGVLGLLFPLFIISLFVLFFKPFIIMFTGFLFGYTKHPSFLSGITLGQVSEFSLIIIAQGLLLGHVSPKIFTLTILLAMVTISLSTYIFKYQDWIYKKNTKLMALFEKLTPTKRLEYIPKEEKVDVVVCGYNRIGLSIVKTLRRLRRKILIVDYNPEVVNELMHKKIHCIYGDVGDLEIIERMHLREVKMVISTIHDLEDDLLLIKKLREVNKSAPIFVTSHEINDALKLYEAGADYVILPHHLGGEHVSLLLEDFTEDLNKMLECKITHIKQLRQHHKLGKSHPHNQEHRR